jgi:hypothetical protein
MAQDEYDLEGLRTDIDGVRIDIEEVRQNVEDRLDELESKLGDDEDSTTSRESGLGAAYSLGSTMAAILSWHSFHAVLWALLAGILSWLYVIYYLVVNWSNVKLI